VTMEDEGIWVKVTLDNRAQITGYAAGAESPNDFWSKFRTQLVRLDDARRVGDHSEGTSGETLYVNRDHILLVEIDEGPAT
jgi:hypothetical protein